MTTTPSLSTAQQATAICFVFWVASYVVPVYLLPVTVFVSLLLAVLVWGIALSGAHAQLHGRLPWVAASGVGALMLLAALQHAWTDALVLFGAGAVLLFGAAEKDPRWSRALWAALLAAALINVLVAAIQIAWPNADLPGVAPSPTPGRAAANLRQPNLFAELLLQGLVALIALQRSATGRWGRSLGPVAAVLLGIGLSFSQSRTGWLGLALLVGWVLLDRHMSGSQRRLPWIAVAGCVLGMALVWLKSEHGGATPYIVFRETQSSDLSGSRFGFWSNALQLIVQYPLTGVGWGQLGQAWALTPFPGRPVAAFDNAHNLPLHLMVELGIPIALSVMGALAWALWRARFALSFLKAGEGAAEARCLLAGLALLGMHSLLEYPLWFTYFLLPAAFFLGRLLRLGALAERGEREDLVAGPAVEEGPKASSSNATTLLLQTCGVLIVLGSLYAAWDYSRVLQAFKPFGAGQRKSLEQRVAEGRKSVLFGYWVDFGVVTNIDTYRDHTEEVERAVRHRMNPHMLMIYAKYLHERGEDDKAAYVAARLREFHHPVSEEFLAECETTATGQPKPFQCVAPSREYSFREILP